MTGHPPNLSHDDLDHLLRDCGAHVSYPPVPDVVDAAFQYIDQLSRDSQSQQPAEPPVDRDDGNYPVLEDRESFLRQPPVADHHAPSQGLSHLAGRALKVAATLLVFAAGIALLALIFRGFDDDGQPAAAPPAVTTEDDQVEIVEATPTSRATQAVATPTEASLTPVPPMVMPTPSISQVDETTAEFSIAWEQTALVIVTRQLIEAYNAGDVEQVLGLLTDDAGWADCDYQAGEKVVLDELEDVEAWLVERIANNDHLEVARMWNENPNSNNVLAIDWTRRTSDELRALGYDEGIQPDGATVVSFRREDGRVLIRGVGTVGAFGTVGAWCEIAE